MASPLGAGTASETSASIEQEKLVAALVRATPLSQLGRAGIGVHDSSLSISSLVLEGAQDNFPTLTPEVSRRTHNPFQKAVNSLRSSGGKGGRRECTLPFLRFPPLLSFFSNHPRIQGGREKEWNETRQHPSKLSRPFSSTLNSSPPSLGWFKKMVSLPAPSLFYPVYSVLNADHVYVLGY